MLADPERYLRSIAGAAISQSRQVRDLIGGQHWLSDGKHKEALLSSLIARYVPAGTIVCSGFVVHPSDHTVCSREQDILVLDALREAPLFYNDGLAVALPETVLAAVSVKTRFQKRELLDTCDTLNSVIGVASTALVKNPIWCGGFFFEDPSPSTNLDRIEVTIKKVFQQAQPPFRNLVSNADQDQRGFTALASAEKLFVKATYSGNPPQAFVTTYDSTGLSAVFFLAHLIDHIATQRGAPEASMVTFANSILVRQVRPVLAVDLPHVPNV